MTTLSKYPRTHHVAGSRRQPGDEDLDAIPVAALVGRHLVIEEKVDGANAAISFDSDGTILLQSRGHYLTGGNRERHFGLLKRWGHAIADGIRPVIGTRYVIYGEWLYAKHTIFYDALPHYFLEFDVLDRQSGEFLDTPSRAALLSGLGFVSVPVIQSGQIGHDADLSKLVGPSAFKSANWRAVLKDASREPPHRADLVARQTDPSNLMEGLYIKVEEQGRVVERLKFVRADFLATVANSESHWQSRPILVNRLAQGVEIFRS